jgi:hypothetical protein
MLRSGRGLAHLCMRGQWACPHQPKRIGGAERPGEAERITLLRTALITMATATHLPVDGPLGPVARVLGG